MFGKKKINVWKQSKLWSNLIILLILFLKLLPLLIFYRMRIKMAHSYVKLELPKARSTKIVNFIINLFIF